MEAKELCTQLLKDRGIIADDGFWSDVRNIMIECYQEGKKSSELGFARTLADKLDVYISDEELKSMYNAWLKKNEDGK